MNIYQEAEIILLDRRRIALKKAEMKYAYAEKDAEFLSIEKELKAISPLLAKARVFQNEKEEKYLQKKQETLQKKKNSTIKRIGLPNLLAEYTCDKCEDTGYLNGKACTCLRQITISLLEKQSGLSQKKMHTFAEFDEKVFGKDSEKVRVLKEKMQQFSACFPNVKKNCILMLGSSGTGKTFLIDCICDALKNRGAMVLYTTAFSLNNLFLKYHTTFDESKNLYMDNLLSCDVLVIDDLGTEPILKNVTKEYLYSVINERKLQGKANIISTNLSLGGAIARYEERTASRIYDKNSTYLINLTTDNIRNKNG